MTYLPKQMMKPNILGFLKLLFSSTTGQFIPKDIRDCRQSQASLALDYIVTQQWNYVIRTKHAEYMTVLALGPSHDSDP